MEQIIGLILAVIIMGLGTVGAVLPGIPGTLLIPVAVLVHRLYFHEHGPNWWVVGVVVILTALTFVLDYLATVWGTKRLGATWRAAVGAVIGGLVGLFFNLPGILLGPFIGAVLLEMTTGRGWKESSRAGLGAMLGLLVGGLGKLALCVTMIGLFILNVIWRSGS